VASEKIREWVQKKLEKGIDKHRIRESLKNTGHDPDIVDDVVNDSEVGDDPFQEDDGGDSESVPEEDNSENSEEMDLEFDETSQEDENETDSKSSVIPSPDVQLPDIHVERKTVAVLGMAVLIAVGMAGVFSYVDSSGVLEPQCSGDEGAGVKVYSVQKENGVTNAEVRVVEDVDVVLEVFDSGEKVGQNVERMDGRGTISVNAIGNKVSFHEYGCDFPSVERNY
jgi:hypothetical protein